MKFSIILTLWAAAGLAASVSYDQGAALFARQDMGEAVCSNCKNSVSCNGAKVNCGSKKASTKKTSPRDEIALDKRQQEAAIKHVCDNCNNNVVCAGQKISCP